MRAILLSTQPKWCGLIASGKKTIEVRKTAPKETPFKVYIYETTKRILVGEHFEPSKSKANLLCGGKLVYIVKKDWYYGSGKVIGEFVCNKVEKIFNVATTDWNLLGGNVHTRDKVLVRQACLTEQEIHEYAKGKSPIYCLNISQLKIYDKPKELGEFKRENPCYRSGSLDELGCWESGCTAQDLGDCDGRYSPIIRPPQSWCYVQELTE